MNNQEIFEELVEKYIIAKSKEDISIDSKKVYEDIEKTLQKLNDSDDYFILNQLQRNLVKLNSVELKILIHFICPGMPFVKETIRVEIYQTLLLLCFKILENLNQISDNDPFYFIYRVYDAIWHNFSFTEKRQDVYQTFFKLTYELLDEKYHQYSHDETGYEKRYCSILFFIKYSSDDFKEHKQDFETLFHRLKHNPCIYEDDELFRFWEKHYQEINQKV